MKQNQLVAGIDIGGTNVRCAIAEVNDPGRIITRRTARTPVDAGPERLVNFISAEVDLCLQAAGFDRGSLVGIGCAAPGITNARAGVVVSAANLRGWRDVPLAQLLESQFGIPASVENDVKAAALGEFKYGAGRGHHSLVYMTVSTGVSAGIVIEGRVLRGQHHFAGEIAYILTEPAHIGKDWGINGCLELTAAGVGIAREWAIRHDDSGSTYSAIDVFEAARAGNAEAASIIERATNYLAQAAVALCTIIDPEVFVLGGGIAENEPDLRDRISKVIFTTLPFPPQVLRAELSGDSPIIGALALAADEVMNSRRQESEIRSQKKSSDSFFNSDF